MSRYELSPAAERDLAAILDFVTRASGSDAADHVLVTILATRARIAEAPRIGHTRADLTPEPVLFWRVYDYRIVYRPDVEPIDVARIYHGARAPWRIARAIDEANDTTS